MSQTVEETPTLVLERAITARTAASVWRAASRLFASYPARPLVIDASRLEHVDTVGLACLFSLRYQSRLDGAGITFQALSPTLEALIQGFDARKFLLPTVARPRVGFLEHVGRSTLELSRYTGELLSFLRLCVAALARAAVRPRSLRWTDILDVATEVGANAVPIVLLMGFLMGVIIAFEVGLVAREFGAVIFVVNGVGKAMLRELGALMTAIVLAGRTGAAFAAQIGTQKVNEELNAILTFGLDPIDFLVLPRLLAALVAVPLLTVFADTVGLVGGALVMANSFDVSYRQFLSQLIKSVSTADLLLGVAKAAVFGLTIAAVGCHRGLCTGPGPASVGRSTTRGVVASIVLIVAIDGLFAVIVK